MWFYQQFSWELFGCFPNLAVTWMIHLKGHEHPVLRSSCGDAPLKTCPMASPTCGCIGFITENEKNRGTVVFVLLWEHWVLQSCREKKNVKDVSSVCQMYLWLKYHGKKGWNSSGLTKGIILSSQFLNNLFFQGFLGGLCGVLLGLFFSIWNHLCQL